MERLFCEWDDGRKAAGEMMRNLIYLSMICAIVSGSGSYCAEEKSYVWWEGENPVETNFPRSTWFNGGAIEGKEHLLSNGNWLTNDGERSGAAAFARYRVEIPKPGDYHLWIRKFWKHGPFRWRFDEGEWWQMGREITLADSVEIATHLGANWVYAGKVSLPEGETTFTLELTVAEGESETACFDCFLLTPTLFVPRGKLKPDERSGDADEGFFSWEPPFDDFSDAALLDLRFLNEAAAGQDGFITTKDGDFFLGNGEPVRFWGVNVSSAIAGLERDSVKYLARSLARRGVNIARYHSPLFDSGNVEELDAKRLDDLFFLIHAFKEEGVYIALSYYFPLWFDIRRDYGIEGYESSTNKKPFALLYFNPRMQEIHRSWVRKLLTTENPYTGRTLAQEPAVAMIEIINEDSFFFWTFTKNTVPEEQWKRLESRFSEWLMERYGSIQDASRAWGGGLTEGDRVQENHAVLYPAWDMTGDAIRQASAAKRKRIGDQVEFLTELQREYYAGMKRYITEELGSSSLISCSNWHVTDQRILDSLERYTYTAGDVIDTHGYFSGEHSSSDGRHSYAVDSGHRFGNLAAVTVPEQLPLQFNQVENYPHMISEIGWTNPNLYRADYAFLASAYGALQGVDAFFAFAVGGAFWDTGMNKFALSSPVILGNFPAYALLYRRGDLQEATAVVHQVLSLEDLYELKGSAATTAQALDELRERDVPPGEEVTGEISSFDPLSYYVGRVERSFSGDTEKSVQINLAPYIDRQRKVIKSLTGELVWDYGKGVAVIDSEKSKGAAGFLAAVSPISIGEVQIALENEYATCVLTSLEDKPLAESERMLIQVMTVERPYGFRASEGKSGEITSMGTYPFGVERIRGSIQIPVRDEGEIRVTVLDENGYPRQSYVKIFAGEPRWEVQFDEESVYYIVERTGKAADVQDIFRHE